MISKDVNNFNTLKIYNIILISIFLFCFINYKRSNPTNIPEVLFHDNQTLNVLFPKKHYQLSCPITLFFKSNFRSDYDIGKFELKQINLKDKNYFVSFFLNNPNYYTYLPLLNEHGLIESKYIYGNNNLFISPIFINQIHKEQQNIYDLSKYQKVYQYILGEYYFQKNIIYSQYKNLKSLFNNDFFFIPETFNYPEDSFLIKQKFGKYHLNLSDLWLIKPTNKYGGEGIKILKSLNEIKYNEFIITKYINNIDLINEKKYDLRLYILISGLKPLRIYFYNEGLVRIASEKYSININNLGNKFVHLTNTDLNKLNKNFIHPNDSNSNNENSNMWNLSMYKKHLKQIHNIEWLDIREKIKDIIIKTIISLQHELIQVNEKRNLSDNSFYNLLGFDILMTDDFIPILLEVNNSPQMLIHNNLDRPIKTNLFVDTLNIVGISPYSRETFKTLNENILLSDEDNINDALCELNRPRGDYELIFPLKVNINKYKKYFLNNSKDNIKFWNQIQK